MEGERPLIQGVAVLYAAGAERSQTLLALRRAAVERPDVTRRVAVLVYDNSPEPHEVLEHIAGFGAADYVHNPANPGLAVAYGVALERAERAGISWLLLLDQDTGVSAGFLEEVVRRVAGNAPEDVPDGGVPERVGAMVPKLLRDGAVLSPEIVGGWRNRAVAASTAGLSTVPLTALNAGSCLRVAAVRATGGFPAEFPLDYLDHAVYAGLHEAGWRVWVLDSALEHGLSLARMEEEMSLDRYRRVLATEWRFVRRSGRSAVVHRVRLLKRAGVQFLRFREKGFGWRTLRAALGRA